MLQKSDWVLEAIQILSQNGYDALTLAALCKAAGKTKGSFYHHFADMSDLRQAVLTHWEEAHTLTLIAMSQDVSVGRSLDELSQAIDWSVERALRAWARWDDGARRAVSAVDKRRVAFLLRRYEDVVDAQRMCWLEYASMIGTQELFEVFSVREQKAMRKTLYTALATQTKGALCE